MDNITKRKVLPLVHEHNYLITMWHILLTRINSDKKMGKYLHQCFLFGVGTQSLPIFRPGLTNPPLKLSIMT